MLHPSSTGQQNASPIANFSKYKNQETGMAPFNNQRLRKGDIIKEYYQKQRNIIQKDDKLTQIDTPYNNENH